MINGAHLLVFSADAAAARTFFRDVLALDSVDAGEGWLIFKLPPAEFGVHPSGGETHHEMYLMCDDIDATVVQLRGRGAEFDDDATIEEAGFGRLVWVRIPGGGRVGVYQPRHPTAI